MPWVICGARVLIICSFWALNELLSRDFRSSAQSFRLVLWCSVASSAVAVSNLFFSFFFFMSHCICTTRVHTFQLKRQNSHKTKASLAPHAVLVSVETDGLSMAQIVVTDTKVCSVLLDCEIQPPAVPRSFWILGDSPNKTKLLWEGPTLCLKKWPVH